MYMLKKFHDSKLNVTDVTEVIRSFNCLLSHALFGVVCSTYLHSALLACLTSLNFRRPRLSHQLASSDRGEELFMLTCIQTCDTIRVLDIREESYVASIIIFDSISKVATSYQEQLVLKAFQPLFNFLIV